MYHIFLSIYASFNFSLCQFIQSTSTKLHVIITSSKHKYLPNEGKSDKLFTFRFMYCMGIIFQKGVNTRHKKNVQKHAEWKLKSATLCYFSLNHSKVLGKANFVFDFTLSVPKKTEEITEQSIIICLWSGGSWPSCRISLWIPQYQ